MRPLESQCHLLGEVQDRSAYKLDVLHDRIRHLIVSVERSARPWERVVRSCRALRSRRRTSVSQLEGTET